MELYIEFDEEAEFGAWMKELTRAARRVSVAGGRGDNHLGERPAIN